MRIRRIIKEAWRAAVLLAAGVIFMPLLAQVAGLAMYGDIIRALGEPQFDAWLLVLTPYFLVTVFRLQRSIRKYLEEKEAAVEEAAEYTEPERQSPGERRFKIAFGALFFLALMSLITYLFYPKPTYKNFYGDVNYCSCFGIEKRFEPNKTFWGPENEEWGVCLGVLYNCQN